MISIVLLAVVWAGVWAGVAGAGQISVDALAHLPPADVIILGEVHDNPAQHQNQARAVKAIAPPALVFEMLTPTQAALATPQNRRDAEALARAFDWKNSGWPDFGYYFPIFSAAPKARIYGAALARKTVRAAVTKGAAAMFDGDAAAFGLDKNLPDTQQRAREAGQMKAHCNALPKHLLGGMVEAQRLRDAALAQAVLRARAETGGPVVVITGNGHARRDWGIAAVLRIAAPDLGVLSIGQFEAPPEAGVPYDLYLLSAPAKRDDPCAAFLKSRGNK